MITRWICAAVLLAWLPAHAAGSDSKPPESVTVTGTRSHEVIQDFVRKFTVPTRVAGKITRWGEGICPQIVGLRPSAVKFIADRLKEVAAEVGAPVNEKPNCTVNIEIVFTTTPQVMIDNVRKKRPELLGYADNAEKIAALAKVVRPIQAWYLTQTRDINGATMTDVARRRDATMAALGYPDAIVMETTGSRLGGGLTSGFQHVIVVVDPAKLTDYPIGQLADYIALLALSHVDTPDTCQPLSSIVNLLVPGCANVPDGLSANDLAYLGGLYRRMNAGFSVSLQRGAIAAAIEDAARGQ